MEDIKTLKRHIRRYLKTVPGVSLIPKELTKSIVAVIPKYKFDAIFENLCIIIPLKFDANYSSSFQDSDGRKYQFLYWRKPGKTRYDFDEMICIDLMAETL